MLHFQVFLRRTAGTAIGIRDFVTECRSFTKDMHIHILVDEILHDLLIHIKRVECSNWTIDSVHFLDIYIGNYIPHHSV